LIGAPGVGKTSLGKSIARATGRDFVRVSLGGVQDEAEIRGHHRNHIGAMPGKIIQSMRKAKSSDPLFLLDGVDRLRAGFGDDPSSALLEVLDPEQNHTFKDHYLEVDYDLSCAMFITTANAHNIPPPLMDCMEIIRISGYTENEKVEISRKHLIPHAIAKHGLKDGKCLFLLRNDRGIEETAASFEARSAPRSYPTSISRHYRMCSVPVTGTTPHPLPLAVIERLDVAESITFRVRSNE
jgi:ATP-dependent Lon protease